MTKNWVAFVSVLLLSGTAAMAGSWDMKTVDADGSGTVSRPEYEKNAGKLGIDPVPDFAAMDKNSNNSISEKEWAEAEKMVKAFPVSCKSSTESWCPKGY